MAFEPDLIWTMADHITIEKSMHPMLQKDVWKNRHLGLYTSKEKKETSRVSIDYNSKK